MKRTIERLLDDEELLAEMLRLPDSRKDALVHEAREEKFRPLWEHTEMERTEVMNLANKRELDFVRGVEEPDIPEWLLRLEAQDMLVQKMNERINEDEDTDE